MIVIQQGVVSQGAIVFERPLELPEGSAVVVRIESVSAPPVDIAADSHGAELTGLQAVFPFIGQWADRNDIADSAEYVRQERAKWQQRPFRRG